MNNLICLGAGKLATQLMPVLEAQGFMVSQVYSRTLNHAKLLASQLQHAEPIDHLSSVRPGADYYFFAITDDAVEEVTGQLSFLENEKSIFVHTSGILSLTALPFQRRGIFYPLQTFSAGHPVDWNNTPILVTAQTPEIEETLTELANKISSLVYTARDQDRAALHVSAVFANNFTNHMLTLAEEICKRHQVAFEILKPIIRETVTKALEVGPANSQTGPAVRGDQHTIDRHLQLLAYDKQLQALYQIITESIRHHGR
jgi:predicted short-subunit dehydrogenase-like oxidoreductase (DUF2520 family)